MFIYSAWANYKLIAKSWPAGCSWSPISPCFSPTEPFSLSSDAGKLLHHTVPLWRLSQQSPQKLTNPVSSYDFHALAYLLENSRSGRTRSSRYGLLIKVVITLMFALPCAFLQITPNFRINTQDGIESETNSSVMMKNMKYATARVAFILSAV